MYLFIDDERNLNNLTGYVVLRSSDEAINYIRQNGWPTFMSLDHDLGGEDTVMVFLKRLVNEIWDGIMPVPGYIVHSANPEGAKNIVSYMDSWKKSTLMP